METIKKGEKLKIKKNYNFQYTKKVLFVIALIILVFFLSYVLVEYLDYNLSSVSNQTHEIKNSDRILIFAPHPDDESLGAGGLIAKAVENNATVLVVIVTDGSSSHTFTSYNKLATRTNITHNLTLPELRHTETLNALKKLGLNESNVIFLGYPDVGLGPMFEIYWDYNNTYKCCNNFNQLNYSPYNFTYEKNAPYAGANVVKNMESIIKSFNPTLVIYPDDGDEHPDHWATNAFVRYSLMELNYTGEEYTYLVHKGLNWPTPPYNAPYSQLNPPSSLLDSGAHWIYVNLNKSEESQKENAINSHQSQVNINTTFFQSFIRTNDLFGIYPNMKISREQENLLEDTLPESSFKDEQGDADNKILNPVDDITAAGISCDDKNFYLYMQTTNINDNFVKNFHLRLFNGKNTKRIDITVKNGIANYTLEASNSIKSTENPTVEINNNLMRVKLPKNIFNGLQEVMMNCDVYDPKTKKQVDKTAWKKFNFSYSVLDSYLTMFFHGYF